MRYLSGRYGRIVNGLLQEKVRPQKDKSLARVGSYPASAAARPAVTAQDARPEVGLFFQQPGDESFVALHLQQRRVLEAETPVKDLGQAGNGQDMLQLREVFFGHAPGSSQAMVLLARALDLHHVAAVGAQAVQAGPHPGMLARLHADRRHVDAGLFDIGQPGHGLQPLAALHGAVGRPLGLLPGLEQQQLTVLLPGGEAHDHRGVGGADAAAPPGEPLVGALVEFDPEEICRG